MYTDSIEQLRGTAGARQVRVRAETALAAFTTPSGGGWIMFGKSRADGLQRWRSPARGDHFQRLSQKSRRQSSVLTGRFRVRHRPLSLSVGEPLNLL
jgi:hypothetical protein